MQEKNSVVEEALIQMKQIEEAISENAKGILASTMKEEINQLVKESLSEQDDEEEKTDVDMDMEMDMDTDNEDEMDMDTEMDVDVEDMDTDMEMDMDMDSDETPIDLTHASDEEILKVFKAMGEDDGIIVKKDGTNVTLKDNTTDSEYLVKLGESKSKRKINEMYEEEDNIDDVIEALFSDSETTDEEMDEAMYEIHMNDDMGEEMEETMYEVEMDEEYEEMDEESEEMDEESEEMDETIYEIVMDEESEEMDEESEEMDEESEEDESYQMDESYSHKKAKKGMKPKGMGMGKPKFSYKKSTGGFKEDMKQGTKGVGMGKAKFEYKEGKNMDGKTKLVKKTETKEAARTYGMGSKEGRGLRKGITPNRNLKMESLESEVSMLREKNEEYRKALNTFREKLNEVATFNSNLAYATRLFTEHSTTKKEKINILRRFDEVETLKESKNLYKSIKEELTKVESKPMNESVETKMNKNVSTGSSTTLIESKTYENPQFLRIKDLMNKM